MFSKDDYIPPASGLPARKVTRQHLAAHLSLSLRTVDELTRKGVLPFFKIGRSVRYDLAEVETAMRERCRVRAKASKSNG